jgi:hypothetical protein
MHIAQGSQVVATTAPSMKIAPCRRHAARKAFTSACAVGSWVAQVVLCSTASTSSASAIAQPKGDCPAATPARH